MYHELVPYALILGGILIGAYFLGKQPKFTGTAMGAVVSAAGLVLMLSQTSMISGAVLDVVSIVMASSFVALAYLVSDKNPRVFLLLPMLVLPTVQSRLFPLPPADLLVVLNSYIVLLLAIVNAYDFSAVDLTAAMFRADKYLRWSLWPFSVLERFAQRLTHSRPSRLPLASTHFIFAAGALLTLSVVIPSLLKGTIGTQEILFGATVYLFVSREECSRGLKQLK